MAEFNVNTKNELIACLLALDQHEREINYIAKKEENYTF